MAGLPEPTPRIAAPELSPTAERAMAIVQGAEDRVGQCIGALRKTAKLEFITGYSPRNYNVDGQADKLRDIANMAHSFALLEKAQIEGGQGETNDTEAEWLNTALQEVVAFGQSGQKLEEINATAEALRESQEDLGNEAKQNAQRDLRRELPASRTAMEKLRRMEAAITIWGETRALQERAQATVDLARAQLEGENLNLNDPEAQAAAETIRQCDAVIARARQAAGPGATLNIEIPERSAALETYRERARDFWKKDGENGRLAAARRNLVSLKATIPVASDGEPTTESGQVANTAIREAWNIMEPNVEGPETIVIDIPGEIDSIRDELTAFAARAATLSAAEQESAEENFRVLIEIADQVPEGDAAAKYEEADRLARQILGATRYAQIEDEYATPAIT